MAMQLKNLADKSKMSPRELKENRRNLTGAQHLSVQKLAIGNCGW